MSCGYQKSDIEFVDYELYELPNVHGVFRGPPVRGNEYIACVGAAQTFGRFVRNPYPKLLSRIHGIETLNLGRGGAGPAFPLSSSALMDYINGARCVIVQVFSGRSQSNSLFRISNYGMHGVNLADGNEASADQFYTWLLTQNEQLVRDIIVETRRNYLSTMKQLLDNISPPKILFWFSVRHPDYQEKLKMPLQDLWGEFPQFVNQTMVDELKDYCNAYVECISRRGLPQLLASGTHIEEKDSKRRENHYYPSPEMHEDAANLLQPVCEKMLVTNS